MSDSRFTTRKLPSGKNSKEDEKRIQEILLSRKRKDFKPWRPKSGYSRKLEVPLGTRLKGEIPRRLDRPYSEIDLSDNSTYNHFDEFEDKFDCQRKYVKDRVKTANWQWNTFTSGLSKSTSIVTREIIPGNKSKRSKEREEIKAKKIAQKRDTKKPSKKTTSKNKKRSKPKLLWSQSYEQAKRLILATRK